jgi:hypothetical protein
VWGKQWCRFPQMRIPSLRRLNLFNLHIPNPERIQSGFHVTHAYSCSYKSRLHRGGWLININGGNGMSSNTWKPYVLTYLIPFLPFPPARPPQLRCHQPYVVLTSLCGWNAKWIIFIYHLCIWMWRFKTSMTFSFNASLSVWRTYWVLTWVYGVVSWTRPLERWNWDSSEAYTTPGAYIHSCTYTHICLHTHTAVREGKRRGVKNEWLISVNRAW